MIIDSIMLNTKQHFYQLN